MKATIEVSRTSHRSLICTMSIKGRAAAKLRQIIPTPTRRIIIEAQVESNLRNKHYEVCWMCGDQVRIACGMDAIHIITVPGTGRGQTAAFDNLIGPRLMEVRKEASRDKDDMSRRGVRDLRLYESDLEWLIDKIEIAAADRDPEFGFFNQFPV